MIKDFCFILNMVFVVFCILIGLDSVINVIGDKVVLMCEVMGFFIFYIGWLFQRIDDEINSLFGILQFIYIY